MGKSSGFWVCFENRAPAAGLGMPRTRSSREGVAKRSGGRSGGETGGGWSSRKRRDETASWVGGGRAGGHDKGDNTQI